MNRWIHSLQSQFYKDFTLSALRVAITLWALFVIVLAWVLNNKWALAGILAYEVLP